MCALPAWLIGASPALIGQCKHSKSQVAPIFSDLISHKPDYHKIPRQIRLFTREATTAIPHHLNTSKKPTFMIRVNGSSQPATDGVEKGCFDMPRALQTLQTESARE